MQEFLVKRIAELTKMIENTKLDGETKDLLHAKRIAFNEALTHLARLNDRHTIEFN